MSQSGKYVVAMGNDRSRVYDVNLKPVVELPKGSFGHADLCMTADGRDLLVYDGADHELDDNRNINIADLQTGKVTIGTRIGWKSTPHVSCRNLDLPGWALISTQGPDGKYPNHDFEIFWLKLDGSGEVRRVAHHHSSREDGGYFAEQHAVTNRNGTIDPVRQQLGRREDKRLSRRPPPGRVRRTAAAAAARSRDAAASRR